MEIYSKLLSAKIYLVVFPLLIFASCATNTSNLKAHNQTSEEKIVSEKTNTELSLPIPKDETFILTDSETKEKLLPQTVPLENGPSITEQESPTKPAQKMLDSALEFCQASFDFWDKGDLDNALEALDQAYSLILKVKASPEEPEILQQRDDLRFTISKRIIECYSSRFTVANGCHKAIPLVMNKHVEKAIKLFTTRGRTFFLEAYRRSGRYRPCGPS